MSISSKKLPSNPAQIIFTSGAAGEAVRFALGEFQQGRNESDASGVALALGASRDTNEGRVPQVCLECGENDTLAVAVSEEGMAFQCPECGTDIETEM